MNGVRGCVCDLWFFFCIERGAWEKEEVEHLQGTESVKKHISRPKSTWVGEDRE